MFQNKKSLCGGDISGFTLIEVLIVIAIIGILAGVGVFRAYESKQKAKNAAIAVEVNSLRLAEELIYSERESYIDPASARADAPSSVERDIKRVWDHIGVLSGGKHKSAVVSSSSDVQSNTTTITTTTVTGTSATTTKNKKPASKGDSSNSQSPPPEPDTAVTDMNNGKPETSWVIAIKLPSDSTGSGYYADAKKNCEFSWPADDQSIDFSLAKTCNAVPRGAVPPKKPPIVAEEPSTPTPIIDTTPVANGIGIRALTGTTQTGRPFSMSRVFRQGEIKNFPQARINNKTLFTQADVKSRWPDNSVKHAILSFVTDVPADASLKVEFINQSVGNNGGEMTKDQMLAKKDWGGEIETSIGSASARAMLADWNGVDSGLNGRGVRYWLKGPIATQVIVEDKTPSLKYDFGSDANRSLHPIFVLTFYPGTDMGVKVEYIVENMWTTKLQDQAYSLTLKTGNPSSATVYSKPLFTHIAQTRWHKTFWSGQAPEGWTDPGHPGIAIDYNFPYITSTRVLPNFDQSVVVSSTDVGLIVSKFAASDKGDIKGQGIWGSKFFGALDDHTEASLVPKTYTSYLYTFDPELYAMLLGQADVSAHVPIHLRESATGKFYDAAKSIDAFGLPLSVNARPTMRFNIRESSTKPADKVIAVGTVTNDKWSPEPAHQPNFTYIPYIITGEWYYGDELHFWSSFDSIFPNANSRHNDWAFMNNIQIRGEARALAAIGENAFIAPDNSYEKAYATEKLFNNIAILEGKHDVRDGSFYQPCTTNPYNDATETSKWCWGRNSPYSGEGLPNPLHLLGSTKYSVEGHDPTKSGYDGSTVEVAKFNYVAQTWMQNYHYITYSHLAELGLPIRKLRDVAILSLLGQLASPDYNPYLIQLHKIPVSKPDGTYFQSWAAVKDAFVDDLENISTITSNNAYNVEVRATASFLPGINSGPMIGQTAWEWISSRTSPSKFPNWAWLPR